MLLRSQVAGWQLAIHRLHRGYRDSTPFNRVFDGSCKEEIYDDDDDDANDCIFQLCNSLSTPHQSQRPKTVYLSLSSYQSLLPSSFANTFLQPLDTASETLKSLNSHWFE